ncbi:hypothetical protein [Rhizobium leguminosarum]|uniref:hypothetical protein n=1 Tax=Rhizobium leguminosarum TaxID=384 RepID=UPI002E119D34|nr:hypothetical protein U8Q02_41660 [Rhizobium leguminosarum]
MFGTVKRVGEDGHALFSDKRDAEKVLQELNWSAEWGENFDLRPIEDGWRIEKSYREKSEGFY